MARSQSSRTGLKRSNQMLSQVLSQASLQHPQKTVVLEMLPRCTTRAEWALIMHSTHPLIPIRLLNGQEGRRAKAPTKDQLSSGLKAKRIRSNQTARELWGRRSIAWEEAITCQIKCRSSRSRISLRRIGKRAPQCEQLHKIKLHVMLSSRWSSHREHPKQNESAFQHQVKIWTSLLCYRWARRMLRPTKEQSKPSSAWTWPQEVYRNSTWIKVSSGASSQKRRAQWLPANETKRPARTIPTYRSTMKSRWPPEPLWFLEVVVLAHLVVKEKEINRYFDKRIYCKSWNSRKKGLGNSWSRTKESCNQEWLIWLRRNLTSSKRSTWPASEFKASSGWESKERSTWTWKNSSNKTASRNWWLPWMRWRRPSLSESS